MYLGVHYLSDMLAGSAAGFVWLVVTLTGVETIVRRREAAQDNHTLLGFPDQLIDDRVQVTGLRMPPGPV